MGLAGNARDVAVAAEEQLRRAGRVGAHLPPRWRWLPRLAHRAFGVTAGYGHRPWRPVWSMVVLWLACAGFFGLAAERGAVVPALSASAAAARALPPAYPAFSPLAFSLEHALPFVDLQQRRWWTVSAVETPPIEWPLAARVVASIETALGWMACLLMLACAVVPLSRGRAIA